jgi:5-methylcytosine-specific restriction endonuclease McrA
MNGNTAMSTIDEHCLALNKNWQPVAFYRLSTAIANVLRDHARIMDPETFLLLTYEEWVSEERGVERRIKTSSGYVPAPEIIVLAHYAQMPPMKVGFNSPNLWKRDEFTCQFCGNRFHGKALTIDHVLPRSRGGGTSWENCVAACSPCNSRKANLTPSEARMALLKTPAPPTWKAGVRIPQGPALASWRPFLAKAGVA